MTLTQTPVASQSGGKPSRSILQRLRDSWIQILYIGIIAGSLGYLALTVDNFATVQNVTNVLNQSAVLGLLAIGMTYVLVGAGIDLSMPANMAFTAIVGTMFMNAGGSVTAALFLMLVVSGGIGFINGIAAGWLQMVPFVVTLAMMTVVFGASVWLTKSVSVTGVDPFLVDLFATKIGPLQVSVIGLFLVTVIASVVMGKSSFGRRLYATGINPRAAKAAGINTDNIIMTTYIVSGITVGLAAIFLISRFGSASANMGTDQIVLDVVSAAVVGGVSIYGGVGKPYAAVLGAIFITAISNATNLMGIDYSTTLVIKGSIIIFFVALDTARRRSMKLGAS
jgi:ribose/xylose/arabinose/galactoside ABC-type transport system permease subunit